VLSAAALAPPLRGHAPNLRDIELWLCLHITAGHFVQSDKGIVIDTLVVVVACTITPPLTGYEEGSLHL
jgi:hypothetical protein